MHRRARPSPEIALRLSARLTLPLAAASRPGALTRASTCIAPCAAPDAARLNVPGPSPTAKARSRRSMDAIGGRPGRRAASTRIAPSVRACRSTVPAPSNAIRALPTVPDRADLALARRRASATVNVACSWAGDIAVAAGVSASAACGAMRDSTASTGFMSGAARSAVRLPCWPALSKRMRPCAAKRAPPRSATDRLSILRPSPP